jgi:hypothetical protein
MTRVLVTGGRTYGELLRDTPREQRGQERVRVYREVKALREALAALHAETPITCLIHGAARGADRHAGEWAATHQVMTQSFDISPQAWREMGKAAGPHRNARMLQVGQPDLVLAAPGGRGTSDMVGRARRAGIPIRKVRP